MYRSFATKTFNKVYVSLTHAEKNWIQKTKQKLQEIPQGKPLGIAWFREKKYLNKRLYFIVDEKEKKILFLAFAEKKKQQEIICFVREHKKELQEQLRRF